MKKLLIALTLLTSLSSVNANCIDRRAAMIEPCQNDEAMFFVQGQCEKAYEFESLYCAIPKKPECIDRRAAMIEPCQDDKELVFVQGQCSKSYEFEHMYCRR